MSNKNKRRPRWFFELRSGQISYIVKSISKTCFLLQGIDQTNLLYDTDHQRWVYQKKNNYHDSRGIGSRATVLPYVTKWQKYIISLQVLFSTPFQIRILRKYFLSYENIASIFVCIGFLSQTKIVTNTGEKLKILTFSWHSLLFCVVPQLLWHSLKYPDSSRFLANDDLFPVLFAQRWQMTCS